MTLPLPRYVIAKPLASGATGTVPTRYRKMGCAIPNEPLGADYAVACGVNGKGGRAFALNGLFDEWWKAKNGELVESVSRYGTVDWLFREYKSSQRYRERVSQRTRQDYELLMQIVLDLPTKRGDRVGQRSVKSISPLAVDKIYDQVCVGPNDPRPRQGEKVVALCRAASRVVRRLHPDCFDGSVPNPWDGVTRHRRPINQAGRDARAGLSIRLGRHQSGIPRACCCGGDLLRISPASRKRARRLPGVARLSRAASAQRHQDHAPQDRCRRVASAGRNLRRRHGQILRGRRSRARAFAAAWHRDDFESIGTGRRETVRPA